MEFHHIHIDSSSAHVIAIDKVIHRLISLEIEHSRHNIMPVLWMLAMKNGVYNF